MEALIRTLIYPIRWFPLPTPLFRYYLHLMRESNKKIQDPSHPGYLQFRDACLEGAKAVFGRATGDLAAVYACGMERFHKSVESRLPRFLCTVGWFMDHWHEPLERHTWWLVLQEEEEI